MDGRATVNDNLRKNTQKILLLCAIYHRVHYCAHHAMETTLVVFVLYTIVYTMQSGELFFMFHRRVPRRLTSEQVVSMMDDLSDNDIPSDSDDDRLESDDGEVESDEVDQSSTSESSSESESDQEPAPPTKRGKK